MSKKKEEKEFDWTHAYIQDPLKEFKKPRKNHTDQKTIDGWRRVQHARYVPKGD